MNIREKTFDAGITINYAEGPPSGPPLVLLHGGSARWHSFEGIMPELASRWHVYAPDLRGHGMSGRTPKRYWLRDFAGDVVAFLERQVGEPARLFGHSLGGIVALMVAGQRTEVLHSVAIGDAPLTRETWGQVLDETRDKVMAWSELSGGQVPMDELVEALKNSPVEMPGTNDLIPMRAYVDLESCAHFRLCVLGIFACY